MNKILKKNNLKYVYVVAIVLAQFYVLMNTNSPTIQWVSGLAGAIYVSTLAINNRFTFLFALVFNGTMLVIGTEHGILSEMIQQPLFIAMAILGFINMNFENKFKVVTRSLDRIKNIKQINVLISSLILIIVWTFISKGLGSPIWWKDGLLGGIALSAQLFSIAGVKSSWFYWMALNALSAWTWFAMTPSNHAMGMLYVLFFINAVVGYISWKIQESKLAFN